MTNYQLLPFNFRRFENSILLTNDLGEYHFLDQNTFELFIEQKLPQFNIEKTSLETKFFLTSQSLNANLIEHYAVRYRTKKRFLFESTVLHMIVLTHKCNQSCKYCHASCIATDDPRALNMNLETVRKTIDFILTFPSDNLKIEFQGGEPTLNFEAIKEAVHYALEQKPQEKTLEFVICTNLTNLKYDYIDFIQEHNIAISTSLDGNEVLHDSCRIFNNAQGTYAKVLENLNKLRDRGIHNISALLTLHANNIDFIEEIIQEYLQQGFNSIFLRSLNPYGNAHSNKEDLSYSVEHYIAAYQYALEYIILLNKNGTYFVEEFTAILLGKILTPYSSGFVDLQSPSGSATSAMIYEINGDIFPSDEARMMYRMNQDEDVLLGNVYKDSRRSIFTNEKLEKLLMNSVVEALPGCAWCAYQPYCGVDPIRSYFEIGSYISFKPDDFLCKMYKGMFDTIMHYLDGGDDFIKDLFWAWARHDSVENISLKHEYV